MDRYLTAIASEEEKLAILEVRRNSLLETNKKKQQVIEKCDEEEKHLINKQDDNLLRREYLENKKGYLKEFFKASVKFGVKTSLWFLGCILFISLLDYNFTSNMQLNVLEVLLGNTAIVALLGTVEFCNVSREFRRLVIEYNGDVDTDIEDTYEKLNLVKMRRTKTIDEMEDNVKLLNEVEAAMRDIQAKILQYRTDRNNLIEALIENLDIHIDEFEYQESDIHKVLEKVIQ